MNTAIKDLQEMVDILKEHGYPGDNFQFAVPINYARTIHAELYSNGIHIEYPQVGDSVLLELANRGKITMQVH